jgi:hypothetical protein
MRTLAFASLALSLIAGCPAAAPACPPDGTGFSDGTGLYCAYGVVVGGFRNCPSDLPNRFDFDDGSFVCSDRPIGSREMIPSRVCEALPACRMASPLDAGATDAASFDAGASPEAGCVGDVACIPLGTGERCVASGGTCGNPCPSGSMQQPGREASNDCPSGGVPGLCCYPTPQCELLGGTCSLPTGPFPPVVRCPAGSATLAAAGGDLGGYRQLGCPNVEAGPMACCIPTRMCGTLECPITELCVQREPGIPGGSASYSCEPRPAACATASDCTLASCTGDNAACVTAACSGTGSITEAGTRVVCQGA